MSEQQDEKTVGTTDATDAKAGTKAEQKADKKAARADKKADRKDRKGQAKRAAAVVGDGANRVRTLIARIVWAVAVVLALVLALGALLITLDANRQNEAVRFILDAANAVDLGIFSRTDGIKEFTGSNAGVKNALFNWGLGAVAWLVIGKVLDKIIRP